MSARIKTNSEILASRTHVWGVVLPYQKPYHPNDKLSVRLVQKFPKLFGIKEK